MADRNLRPTIATIGIYCFDAETFLATLAQAQVSLLVDVRQRRGVRGPHFTWANVMDVRYSWSPICPRRPVLVRRQS